MVEGRGRGWWWVTDPVSWKELLEHHPGVWRRCRETLTLRTRSVLRGRMEAFEKEDGEGAWSQAVSVFAVRWSPGRRTPHLLGWATVFPREDGTRDLQVFMVKSWRRRGIGKELSRRALLLGRRGKSPWRFSPGDTAGFELGRSLRREGFPIPILGGGT